jgi:4-amino-4-deoxy-L-arabinose transferase-like glycosyltransferase
MLMKQCVRSMGYKCLVWMVLMSVVAGFSTTATAAWYQLPSYLVPPDVLSLSEDEDVESRQALIFYMPDVYETHRITGYTAVALTLLALVSGDDSSLHKVSGVTAAAFGVAAGASGHIAYGEGIDFRDGWTRENIHAGSGYLATAALVLTAVLGVADESHSAAGGIAAAAVIVPVAVFTF